MDEERMWAFNVKISEKKIAQQRMKAWTLSE